MEIALIIIGILMLIGVVWIIFEFKRKDSKDGIQDVVLESLKKELEDIRGEFKGSLEKNLDFIQKQTGQSHRIISEVTEKITSLDKTNQQVVGITDKLQNLEKVLLSQKKRGNLGEAGLKLVLENMLPPTAFQFQYEIDKERRVDAAIFTKDGIIPVDAKFSLENYTRILDEENEKEKAKLENEFKNDLKKTIDQTSKYIDPKLGTLDFAFMFIPSEAIYYDLLVNEVGAVKVNTRSLIEYAFKEKKVIIVSPTTFAAYLQTVLQGLNALKIEKQTKEIIKRVGMLQRHLIVYDDFFKKIGTHLGTTVSTYNLAYKEFGKIDKDVVKITDGDAKVEPLELDKPSI